MSNEERLRQPTRPRPDAAATRGGSETEQRQLILIVEDEENLRSALALNLQRHGYRVVEAADGIDGLQQARTLLPDLIVLDVLLPYMDGRQVCRAIREESSVPILILTALDREMDVVNSFDIGADDYVSKPFSVRELIARINALLRRTAVRSEEDRVLTAGDLTIFVKEHRAVFHGRELHLPLKEFRILTALVSRAGEVYTRAELLEIVWGEGVVVDERNVDVRIRWLRERLEGDPDGSHLIQTVHGVGYRFAG